MEIKEILELDEKRTQGEWEWKNPDNDEPVQGEYFLRTVEHFGDDLYTTISLPKFILNTEDVSFDDAQFIAAAPRMVEIIKEQDKQIKEFKGFPSEEVCDAARSFLLGLEIGFNTYESMIKHLTLSRGYAPDWMKGRTGHLTKWDKAECIFKLMSTKALVGGNNG